MIGNNQSDYKNQRKYWCQQDDAILIKLCSQSNQPILWNDIQSKFNSSNTVFKRTKKQCKDRWDGYLKPQILKKVHWTNNLEQKIIDLIAKGYSFAEISKQPTFLNISANKIKNRFRTIMNTIFQLIKRWNIKEEELQQEQEEQVNISLKVYRILLQPKLISQIDQNIDIDFLINSRQSNSNHDPYDPYKLIKIFREMKGIKNPKRFNIQKNKQILLFGQKFYNLTIQLNSKIKKMKKKSQKEKDKQILEKLQCANYNISQKLSTVLSPQCSIFNQDNYEVMLSETPILEQKDRQKYCSSPTKTDISLKNNNKQEINKKSGNLNIRKIKKVGQNGISKPFDTLKQVDTQNKQYQINEYLFQDNNYNNIDTLCQNNPSKDEEYLIDSFYQSQKQKNQILQQSITILFRDEVNIRKQVDF